MVERAIDGDRTTERDSLSADYSTWPWRHGPAFRSAAILFGKTVLQVFETGSCRLQRLFELCRFRDSFSSSDFGISVALEKPFVRLQVPSRAFELETEPDNLGLDRIQSSGAAAPAEFRNSTSAASSSDRAAASSAAGRVVDGDNSLAGPK